MRRSTFIVRTVEVEAAIPAVVGVVKAVITDSLLNIVRF